MVDARKSPHGPAEVEDLLGQVGTVYVGRGKKFVKMKVQDLQDDEARKPMFGPTGNLRAPTLRFGKTLLVGFCAPMYEEFLS